MPLTPGTRLGPYEIVSPLGQGGMGIVFRARDTKLEREVDFGREQGTVYAAMELLEGETLRQRLQDGAADA